LEFEATARAAEKRTSPRLRLRLAEKRGNVGFGARKVIVARHRDVEERELEGMMVSPMRKEEANSEGRQLLKKKRDLNFDFGFAIQKKESQRLK